MAPEVLSTPRKHTLRGDVRWPWATTACLALAVCVHLWPSASAALIYDRTRVLDGQWWRIVTGTWVHFSLSHLLWNALVVAFAGIWCERIAPIRTRALHMLAPIGIGLVLLTADAGLERYAGLSGVATAIVTLLALTHVRAKHDRWLWFIILAAVAGKIAFESMRASPIFAHFDEPTIRPVALAHLTGAVIALALHLIRPRSTST